MLPNLQETADLVSFTGEILIGKLYFLCNSYFSKCLWMLMKIPQFKVDHKKDTRTAPVNAIRVAL